MHVNSRFSSMVHVVAAAAALGGFGQGGGSAAAQTTYIVNTLLDSQDALPGNGACLDANGFCSLRAAVMAANATAGVVNIRFAVNGTHTLTIGGTDDICLFGDLDVNPTALLTDLNSRERDWHDCRFDVGAAGRAAGSGVSCSRGGAGGAFGAASGHDDSRRARDRRDRHDRGGGARSGRGG